MKPRSEGFPIANEESFEIPTHAMATSTALRVGLKAIPGCHRLERKSYGDLLTSECIAPCNFLTSPLDSFNQSKLPQVMTVNSMRRHITKLQGAMHSEVSKGP